MTSPADEGVFDHRNFSFEKIGQSENCGHLFSLSLSLSASLAVNGRAIFLLKWRENGQTMPHQSPFSPALPHRSPRSPTAIPRKPNPSPFRDPSPRPAVSPLLQPRHYPRRRHRHHRQRRTRSRPLFLLPLLVRMAVAVTGAKPRPS